MKISIIGLGYVGFPLACAITRKTNHQLVGFDLSHDKITKINNRISPVDDQLAERDIKEFPIKASNDTHIIKDSEIYIICVPTPVLDGYLPDLTAVETAVKTVCRYLKKGQSVIIESTINPGVCDEVIIPMMEEKTNLKSGIDFDLAHCPERINPGDANWSVYNIPRNIGSTSAAATKKIADLYREFIDGEINEMPDIKSTEATKIIENTFRDVNIAYVNELAKSFDVLGINLDTVIKAASNKPFAFMPHFPSCGVGGHCIPVDPYYLIERAKQSGFDHKFLKLAREINNSMPTYTIDLLSDKLNEIEKSIKGTKIGMLGLSYKANVGDLRESPSIEIKNILERKGAELYIFDPFFPSMSNCTTLDELLEKSDAIVIATDHTEFKAISLEQLTKNKVKIIIDGKNCISTSISNSGEVIYKGIGR